MKSKIEIVDVEQGSEAWFRARMGIPTASEFSTILADGRSDGVISNTILDALVKSGVSAEQLSVAVKEAKKKNSSPSQQRRSYMMKLAGEIMTDNPMGDEYTNLAMIRGKEMEKEARELYALTRGETPQVVGFIKNELLNAGCSPDSLLGKNGGLEIKSAAPHVQIERLLSARGVPSEHVSQVQGSMWVTDREWWDFVSYCPGLPLYIVRAPRDETYSARLDKAIPTFNDELSAMVASLKMMK